MQPIIAALDSVFAASADDFYDRVYDQGAPKRGRGGEWEDWPTESNVYADSGIGGRYLVKPEEHTYLAGWTGPQGEKVEYSPEHRSERYYNTVRPARYSVEHKLPDGTIKYHTISPPEDYPNPAGAQLGHPRWYHSYTHFDPAAPDGEDGIIEGRWPIATAPDPHSNSLRQIMDNIGRLNSGESVYPEPFHQDEA